MQVALLAGAAPAHNAVGNLLAEKAAFFRERGAETRTYVVDPRRLHPTLAAGPVHAGADVRGTAEAYLRGCDAVFVEFSVAHPHVDWLARLAGGKPRLFADYYGISPADGWPGPQRELMLASRAQQPLLACADAVFVLSRFGAAELRAALALPEERVVRLGAPVDLARWRGDRTIRDAGPSLLFVGRLAPNKRVGVAIESLARLDSTARLLVVGDASDVYAAEARRARELAAALGVGERVIWRTEVADAEMPALMGAADVLVFPSVHEGLGLPALEAMACGLPVVAARAAALPETIGDAGLLFRPDDVADCVRQIREALRPGVAASLRARGLAHVQAFARDAWRARLADAVDRVLHAAPPRFGPRAALTAVGDASFAPGERTAYLDVELTLTGDEPLGGPCGGSVALDVRTDDDRLATTAPLPTLVGPGGRATWSLPFPVPEGARACEVALWPEDAVGRPCGPVVRVRAVAAPRDPLRTALDGVAEDARLPTDFVDVCEGRFARAKRWVKEKLLHNFRVGHVDVLARRQTRVNDALLAVCRRLADRCDRLEARVADLESRTAPSPAPQESPTPR